MVIGAGRGIASRAALVLDGTASRTPFAAGAAVITFWMQFRNDTAETLLDLTSSRASFTDEWGAALEYDEAPVTVAGRTDRIAPGAGFVTVARHTVAHLEHRRLIRNVVAMRAVTSGGDRIEHCAGLEVSIDPSALSTVRFTPMIGGVAATRRVIYARLG